MKKKLATHSKMMRKAHDKTLDIRPLQPAHSAMIATSSTVFSSDNSLGSSVCTRSAAPSSSDEVSATGGDSGADRTLVAGVEGAEDVEELGLSATSSPEISASP